MKRAQLIIAASVFASATPAGANLISNGGFEQGTFGDGSVRVISPGDTALTGWTVNDNPIAWYTSGYEPPNALEPIRVAPNRGDFAANLGDGSVREASIRQTFPILPFIEQQVSFWVGNYRGNGGPVSIGVTIQDGTSNTILLSEIATAPATDLDSDWEEFTYSYISQVVDGTSNTISFSEIGGAAYAGLDDVTVVAIPEPSTWGLALLGFASVGLLGMIRGRLAPA